MMTARPGSRRRCARRAWRAAKKAATAPITARIALTAEFCPVCPYPALLNRDDASPGKMRQPDLGPGTARLGRGWDEGERVGAEQRGDDMRVLGAGGRGGDGGSRGLKSHANGLLSRWIAPDVGGQNSVRMRRNRGGRAK